MKIALKSHWTYKYENKPQFLGISLAKLICMMAKRNPLAFIPNNTSIRIHPDSVHFGQAIKHVGI